MKELQTRIIMMAESGSTSSFPSKPAAESRTPIRKVPRAEPTLFAKPKKQDRVPSIRGTCFHSL